MTPHLEALARRAVACKHWRWLPGMLNGRDGSRHMGGLQWAWEDPYRHHALGLEIDDWPDLSDPLTVQAVLLLAREAWNRPTAYLYYYGGKWFFDPQQSGPTDHPSGRTEADTAVAALEAAP